LESPVFFLVRVYRRLAPALRTLLPFSTACPFVPSCSEYFELAVRSNGFWRGLGLGLFRILRCHPWSSGGLDLPPGVSRN
jgi:putative membrane protein insertion efficiency factor